MLQANITLRPRSVARCCLECEYSLVGLRPDQPCPECGHWSRYEGSSFSPHIAWARSVFLGLTLLVCITMTAVCSVLIQPFQEIGGTAPALNLPGPKLWAVPLLQRPIGKTPELPGVIGTRTAMLSLLAIWLITAPCGLTRLQRDQVIRLIVRWGSVLLFGLAFGAMMSAQDLWPSELPPFRLLLVAGVELPAGLMLYLYFCRLSEQVPGQARRGAFGRLAWFVPLTILAGAVLLGAQWWWASAKNSPIPQHFAMTMGAAYATFAMLAGVAATAAVGSLAAAYFQLGFPGARRAITAGRWGFRRLREMHRSLNDDRFRAICIAGGAVLLVIVMVLGVDQVMWMSVRDGLGGNLPFVNYPGPKIWTSAANLEIGSRYAWQPLVSRTTLLVLNLLAVWLLTVGGGKTDRFRLRMVVRWLPVVLIGIIFGCVAATRSGRIFGVDVEGSYRSEFFALLTFVGEMPATILLYILLAHLSREYRRPKLARHFNLLCGMITLLVGCSLAMFYFSRWYQYFRTTPLVLLAAALFGAMALVSAVWATVSILALSRAALVRGLAEPLPLRMAHEKRPASRAFSVVSTNVIAGG